MEETLFQESLATAIRAPPIAPIDVPLVSSFPTIGGAEKSASAHLAISFKPPNIVIVFAHGNVPSALTGLNSILQQCFPRWTQFVIDHPANHFSPFGLSQFFGYMLKMYPVAKAMIIIDDYECSQVDNIYNIQD